MTGKPERHRPMPEDRCLAAQNSQEGIASNRLPVAPADVRYTADERRDDAHDRSTVPFP